MKIKLILLVFSKCYSNILLYNSALLNIIISHGSFSKDEILAKLSSNVKYFTTKKSEISRWESSHKDKSKDKCKIEANNAAIKEHKESSCLSYSTKIPEGLFKKLRMVGNGNKTEASVEKYKNSKIRHAQNVRYLR